MKESQRYYIGILATHPIQYYVPWYRALAKCSGIKLKVFYCHRQSPQNQAEAGFGVEFEWDIPLFEDYEYRFLDNRAACPSPDRFFGCDTPEVKEVIAKERFDAFIVHGWYVKSFWQAINACRRRRIPILVRGDSYLLSNNMLIKEWLKYPVYRWFMPKFDGYLAVGKYSKEYYLYYGADREKIFFVPHAVDNEQFALSSAELMPEHKRLRKDWAMPEDAVVFLFAGKLISKKRPHDFIEALESAHKRSSKVFGLIAGDGPLRAGLESTIKKNNLPVSFTGFLNQTEMPKAYAASDVLVLPSDIGETWGLVVNEAFACGLPAIVSDRAGCVPDLIFPKKTGKVYKCGDIQQLSEIFVDFASEPVKLKKMGREARDKIKEYSISRAVENTLEAIRLCCRQRRIMA